MSGPPLPANAATPERKRPHKLTQTRVLDAKYQLGEELGRGASGRVYRAFNRETGEFCAIKEIAIKDMPESGLRSVQSEIELLHTLQHERIVQCYETVRTSDHLYIVLELMGNGSLASIVKKFGRFPEPLVATYARQVLEGLEHLHAHGVCHRDIKGANVLIAREGEVELADLLAVTLTLALTLSRTLAPPLTLTPALTRALPRSSWPTLASRASWATRRA